MSTQHRDVRAGDGTRNEGPERRCAGPAVQRRDRHGVHGPRLQPGGEPRVHRRDRGREDARDHVAGLRADVPHRRGLPRAEPGRARLRHHVHVGGPRVRAAHGLDGRLGHHRRRHHRDGQPRADRGLVLVPPVRAGRAGRRPAVVHRRGRRVDPADDLHLLPRHRGLRPDAVRAAGHRAGRADRVRRDRAGEGVLRRPRPTGSIVPSLDWLWPGGLSLSDFVDAVLIAVFLYWGWDTAVAVNEESRRPRHHPRQAPRCSRPCSCW